MKMKNIFMNKHFGTGLRIFLMALCSALILIGCPFPEWQYIPEGMGSFSLQLEGSQLQGRTILPGTGAANNRFAIYRLDFSGATVISVDREYEAIGEAVLLNPGSHTLTVYGYTSAENRTADKPAARGETTFTITAGQPATGTVNLLPITGSGLKGIFDLNITYPDGLSSVTMELQSISSPGNNTTYTIVGSGSNQITRNANLELDPGQYRVIFTLERSVSNPVKWLEVLHIAANMTSSYTYNFTEDHFAKKTYTISFMVDGNSVADQTYFYDDNNVTAYTHSKAGFTFRGWYTTSTFDTLYTFGTALTGDTNVYAWFQENLTGTVSLKITTEGEGVNEIQTVEIDSLTGLNSGLNQGQLTYQWFFNNILQTGATNDTYTIPNNQLGGNFRLEIRHPLYSGFISHFIGAPLRGETADNPLIVNSIATLRMVGTGELSAGGIWAKDAFYRQTANITVGSAVWIPVSERGGNTNPFIGNYNGDGFDIRDITWTSVDNQSIFGTIGTDGVVENIIAVNPRITGRDRLGVIASVNHGTIRRSVAYNSNINGRDNIGGIAGENSGTIENCYTTGVIFGHGVNPDDGHGLRAGGITGLNTGTVGLCYSTATITGDNFVGGIVGQNDGGTVTNCVALNPNITSRGPNAGRVSAGTGTFTNNSTRGDSLATSIRITGTGTRTGHDGTNRLLGAALSGTLATVVFNTSAGNWITENWIIPTTTPANALNLNQPLPSLRMPAPRTSPVPTLPLVRARTGNNTATFNIDVRNFITFNQRGDDGYWVKPVVGNWVLGEMIEGAPSGPIPVPQNIVTAIEAIHAHQFADNNQSLNEPLMSNGVKVGSLIFNGRNNNPLGRRIEFTLTLDIPVISAEIVFVVNNGAYNAATQRYICPREGVQKTGFHFPLTSGNTISGTLIGGNGAHFPNGNSTIVPHIFVETYGDWTYLPNDVNISDPYVIFEASDRDDYYWFDENRGHGHSSGMGATDLFTSIEGPSGSESEYTFLFEPKVVGDFNVSGNAVQAIPGTLWVRTARTDTGAVFRKKIGGPDRSETGFDYTFPLTEVRTNRDRASRITPNIVLDTGEIVGTAEIILVRATTTTQVASPFYNFSFGTANPVEIEIVLHLNEDFRHDLRATNAIQLQAISNTNILTPGFDGNVNSLRTIPSNNTILFRNVTGNATGISRFDRTTTAGSGLIFQFNYQ